MTKYYLDFHAYAICESKDEAERLFDAVDTAAEGILCGRKGLEHVCPREWTSGGSLGPVKDEDEESVDEVDAADEAFRDILDLCTGWHRPMSGVERVLAIKQIAEAALKRKGAAA